MAGPDIDFLMAGDPVIRWQTMRDLLDAPASEWEAERARVAHEGWGAAFLSHRLPDGNWPNARWTGTVWTLLQLVDLGIPRDAVDFAPSFEAVVGRLMPLGAEVSPRVLLTQMDLCHLGFWLRIGAWFLPDDPRLSPLAEVILSTQLADGGFNCRMRTKKVSHSSFHTTFNVLEGLRLAAEVGVVDRSLFDVAEARAVEFMLQHQMYRSDKTGEIVSERFTHFSFPSHWHYTVLRGLDYVRQTPFIRDPRLRDPLELIASRRKPSGRWPVEHRIPGESLFDMEKMGGDSSWNTLRAARVLRATGMLGPAGTL